MSDFADALAAVRDAERELMLQRKRVATLRRDVPPAPAGADYEFEQLVDRSAQAVRLSELFTAPDRTLIVCHFMYGKRQTTPCPMCAAWADGWNAVAHHVAERADFVVAAAAPIADWTTVAHERGWTNLRLASAAPSTFKVDIGGEDTEGNQWPFISVWTLDDDGHPRQRYGGAAQFDDDHWRGLDLLNPVWHLLDLTPEGRGDWMPSL